MRKLDLHCHSSSSSGAIGKPPEIARFFKKHGYSAFGLTEHNNFESLTMARESAESLNIEYVPGMELTVRAPDIEGPENTGRHLLVFFYETNRFMAELTEKRMQAYEKHMREFLLRLKKLNIADITEKDLQTWIPKRFGEDDVWKLPYRGHGPVSDLLKQRGALPENGSRTVRDLARETGCTLGDPDAPVIGDILPGLRAANATLILAHPIRADMTEPDDAERLRLNLWLDRYADGLEIFYEKYGPDQRRFLLDIVRTRNRPFTGGSDSHSYNDMHPDTNRWSDAPYACLESLREFRDTGTCNSFPNI